MKKRIITILAAVMLINLAACNKKGNDSSVSSDNEKSAAVEQTAAEYDFSKSTLSIERPQRAEDKPMGEEGTWTVFVYMCGSDLETKMGFASGDIQEMIDSSTNDKVRFVVETGGAKEWKNGSASDKLQRYEIANGKAELVDEQSYASMGESGTLSDFLKWGIEKYPAGNMGLVLWDHGGGSINGVCFDEKSDYDRLFLKELDSALFGVYDTMTEPFEFIGFDACLMSSVETAAILSTHSKYMVASEETESGYGWDYKAIGDYLASEPTCGGEDVGKVICDSFYDSCDKLGKSGSVTMSVTDLSKIDTVLQGFDIYANELYNLTGKPETLTSVVRNVFFDDKFGSNTRRTGYTNMADLGGLISAGKDIYDKADELLKAIDECVVYKKNGWQHYDASGLSIYYPFGINITAQTELSIFKDICVSPYYLSFVDKLIYGAVNFDISGYDNSSLISDYSNNWSGGYSSDYSYDSSTDIFDYVQGYQNTGHSGAITFSSEPALGSDGHYSFTLSQTGSNNTDTVQSSVYFWLSGKTQMFELGDSGNITANYQTGQFKDNFDGKWFSLPDGQLLSVYLSEKHDDHDIYFSPIMLNGSLTYLRFGYNNSTGKSEIIDVCDFTSDSGMSSRSYSLEKGDSIKPVNFIRNAYSGKKNYITGKEYIYGGENELSFAFLPKGEYWYSFRINDIYGDYYETEPVCFRIKNDTVQQITFENETHKWIAATCTAPKTCAFCGKTEGKAAGHKWSKATCDKPQTCSVCGETKGKAAGHKWKDATFTEPKTCEVCGKTKGKPISTPIGSGYVDYTFIDVDNDGDKEYIELYERMVGQGPYVYYMIYENKNDYYEIHCDAYGNLGHNYDYLAVNKSTGELCVYTVYISNSNPNQQYESYKLGYYDRDENRIMVCEAKCKTNGLIYYIPGESFDSNENVVSKSEFESAINNISLLYSYRDPSYSHFRDYNNLSDSNSSTYNTSPPQQTVPKSEESAYMDKLNYDVDNDGKDEVIEIYDGGLRYRIYDTKTSYKDVTGDFGLPFIVYDSNRQKSNIYYYMGQNSGGIVFDENNNEILSITYKKENGAYVLDSCLINGKKVTEKEYLDYVNYLQIVYSYLNSFTLGRIMPPEYW